MNSFSGKVLFVAGGILLMALGSLALLHRSNRKVEAGQDEANMCVRCHTVENVTPLQVEDWRASQHAKEGITCDVCHGDEHTSRDDVTMVAMPTPDMCCECHEEQLDQFRRGKHALAWVAQNAMPATHYQPMELMEGKKGCGGCHKIGLKTEEEIRGLKAAGLGYGVASCDACHTRHTFSVAEALQPEACSTCHMGFDHPHWEMWSQSKHGVRYALKRVGVLPADAAAPSCQTCHMSGGNHEVRTAWGFLAVRLPMPDEPQWAAQRATILKALGVLDPDGNPTDRLEVVKAADVVRLTQDDWQKERNSTVSVCSQCHSEGFALGELKKGDGMIRQADRLMAEAVETVASLYRDGIISRPKGYSYAYPDLLTFREAATPIELRLFEMFLKHRMRTFQGTFHSNPDYAFWYGWSEMRADLTEITDMARRLRSERE